MQFFAKFGYRVFLDRNLDEYHLVEAAYLCLPLCIVFHPSAPHMYQQSKETCPSPPRLFIDGIRKRMPYPTSIAALQCCDESFVLPSVLSSWLD